jgi:hypothetical protein
MGNGAGAGAAAHPPSNGLSASGTLTGSGTLTASGMLTASGTLKPAVKKLRKEDFGLGQDDFDRNPEERASWCVHTRCVTDSIVGRYGSDPMGCVWCAVWCAVLFFSCSKFFGLYISPLIELANGRPLEQDDMWKVSAEDDAKRQTKRVVDRYNAEKKADPK